MTNDKKNTDTGLNLYQFYSNVKKYIDTNFYNKVMFGPLSVCGCRFYRHFVTKFAFLKYMYI